MSEGLRERPTMGARTEDFFDFEDVAYLNCAYMGPLPRIAAQALERAGEQRKRPHLISEEMFFSVPQAYREQVAGLIGCAPIDVVIADSTTHGIMLVVNGLDWARGDEVVLLRGAFPSNHFPWRSLEAQGVVVCEIDPMSERSIAEQLDDAISERTRVVSLSWVTYSLGRRLDVAEIGRECRRRGVIFVIDGSQGIGGLPFDLNETPCDLLACSGYKWMLGPYGLGFTYVDPELGWRLKLANINWMSIDGAHDFNRLGQCELKMVPGASRFDVNETANFFNLAAGTAALRYLNEVGPAAVERHVRALQDRLIDGLPTRIHVASDLSESRRSNLLCLAGESEGDVDRAFERLRASKVIVSRREGRIRFSPHLYNTEQQIDRALESLAAKRVPQTPQCSRTAVDRVGERVALSGEALTPRSRALPGQGVSLHPVSAERDIDDLYTGSHGNADKERLWTYLTRGPFPSKSAMHDWLSEAGGSTDPLFFVVADNTTDARVGMAAMQRIRPASRCLEVAHIWYLPSHQRTRANTETVYLLLREAFEQLGYRRVEWKCDALNIRSRAAALRLGFQFEGVFRKHMIIRGRNRDTAWFSMIDTDWPTCKDNIERWLQAAEPFSLTRLTRGDE